MDLSTFRLNSPLGKRILALTREGNYAHPGEEEAIRMALAPLAGESGDRWLDAGCGRGGTAAYVQRQGWAEVTAFDIDTVSIEEARTNYPDVRFYECGVLDAPSVVPGPFDLIYAFNAFYAFPEQPRSLVALRSLATPAARLMLFDYADRGGFYDSALARMPEGSHWHPLDEGAFPRRLAEAAWELEETRNLDVEYRRWYAWLVKRFESRREALEEIAPPEAIAHARNVYVRLLEAIDAGALGGTIVTARAR